MKEKEINLNKFITPINFEELKPIEGRDKIIVSKKDIQILRERLQTKKNLEEKVFPKIKINFSSNRKIA